MEHFLSAPTFLRRLLITLKIRNATIKRNRIRTNTRRSWRPTNFRMMRNIFSMINHCPWVVTNDCVPATAARIYYFFAFTVGFAAPKSVGFAAPKSVGFAAPKAPASPTAKFSPPLRGFFPPLLRGYSHHRCAVLLFFAFTVGFAAPKAPAPPTAKFHSPLRGFFDRPPGGQMLPLATL